MIKQDEINLILNQQQEIHPKRKKYLQEKHKRKGWTGIKLEQIKTLISKERKLNDELDNHVVIIQLDWLPPICGILVDCGDNGWHLYTKKTIKQNYSYYIQEKDVIYVEQHPNPKKIWTRINYLAWKYLKREDYFHSKVSFFYPKNKYNLSIGECYPFCQCKTL